MKSSLSLESQLLQRREYIKKKTLFIVLSFALGSFASPVRSMIGANGNELVSDSSAITAESYIRNGLVVLWDGIENAGWGAHDDTLTIWSDLIGGVQMKNSSFGADYAIPTWNTITDSSHNPFYVDTDFTLHGTVVNPPRVWTNWTLIGIGLGGGAQNGFCLSGQDGAPNYHVIYRKSYGGAIECMVPTYTTVGEQYTCDIVFYYSTKTYYVYVNGILTGSATIPEGSWNLDGARCFIGYGVFQSMNYFGDFRAYNVMYYNRALTEDEILYNYAIDIERFYKK